MNTERLSKGVGKWVYPLSKLMSRVAMVILFFMMGLTVIDVFMRKVFSNSILGSVELTEYMLVILIFLSLAETEVTEGHVKVDLIMGRFGERAQALADAITQGICFLLSGLITWSGVAYAVRMKASGEVSQDLWIPKFPFVYVVAVGCGILSLILLIKFLIALTKMVEPHGQEPGVPGVRRNPPKLQSSFAKASEDTRIPPRPGDPGFLRRRVKS